MSEKEQKTVPFNRELIDKMVEMSINKHLDLDTIKESIKKEIFRKDVVIYIKQFDMSKPMYTPAYSTPGASGMDICSCEDVNIFAKGTSVVHTNISVEIPQGYEIQVRPRSGLAAKYGITVLNTPGTVDCFSNDMKITTINGEKSIDDIHLNEVLPSCNDDLQLEKDDVVAIIDKGKLDVLVIETDDGILEVTPNTLVYTDNGHKYAKDLGIGDNLIRIE